MNKTELYHHLRAQSPTLQATEDRIRRERGLPTPPKDEETVACTCGWERPIIVIYQAELGAPVDVTLRYDCPRCGEPHVASKLEG